MGLTRVVLDTSVLIAEDAPGGTEAAISVMSIAELHFGLLVARTDADRALRANRLAAVEAAFAPLPVTVEIARAHGALAAQVRAAGGAPRRRSIDLVIAATAMVHDATLVTHNVADFAPVADRVPVCRPEQVA